MQPTIIIFSIICSSCSFFTFSNASCVAMHCLVLSFLRSWTWEQMNVLSLHTTLSFYWNTISKIVLRLYHAPLWHACLKRHRPNERRALWGTNILVRLSNKCIKHIMHNKNQTTVQVGALMKGTFWYAWNELNKYLPSSSGYWNWKHPNFMPVDASIIGWDTQDKMMSMRWQSRVRNCWQANMNLQSLQSLINTLKI